MLAVQQISYNLTGSNLSPFPELRHDQLGSDQIPALSEAFLFPPSLWMEDQKLCFSVLLERGLCGSFPFQNCSVWEQSRAVIAEGSVAVVLWQEGVMNIPGSFCFCSADS